MKQIYRFRNSKQIAWILTGILFFILSGTTLKAQCPLTTVSGQAILNCTGVFIANHTKVNLVGIIDHFRLKYGDLSVAVVEYPTCKSFCLQNL
jgi:hypothetical protein